MCEKCENFVHLHVHSENSIIDGLGTMDKLVSSAKNLGFKALGLTDHGTLAGSIDFVGACNSYGIKPIMGLESYVMRDNKRFHLTLLADGNVGFNTLVELNNIAQNGTDNTRPSFDLSLLRKHHDGLIVLSGCAASPLQDLDYSDAYNIGLELKDFLGTNLFAEVMFVSNDHAHWERAAKLAKDLRIAPILTNDCHFPLSTDATAHSNLVQIKSRFSYESRLLFLATEDELRARVTTLDRSALPLFEKSMMNAGRLANKITSVTFSSTPKLPHIPNADAELAGKASLALTNMFPSGIPQNYIDRVTDEIAVIHDMGFSTYFLILQDIIQFARRNKIRVGEGRGSGVGSLVCYLLGITGIDPIPFGLSFDRFLNRKRKEMPDIDTDIEDKRRGDVLDYAHKKWGAIQIATYSRYSHKVLTHDLSKFFKVDRELDEQAADGGKDSDAFKKIVNAIPDFKLTYDAMEDQIRHIGKHAGGVIIVDEDTKVPLIRTTDGGRVAGWTEGENRDLGKAGVVKFDLLGLSALTTLRRLEEKFGFHADDPVDNSPVFELFRNGNTNGIFQFAGSRGIIEFTREVNPTKFEDLVAINALYRPGALDSGAAKNFPEWRKKPRLLHPLIDYILIPTAGVICYQEQMMEIYKVISGGDMSDADNARKVMVKSKVGNPEWEKSMSALREKFFEGALDHGLSKPLADKIWGELSTHTKYSFNKSHAVAYSYIAWQLAWWKYYHTIEFYAATMSVDRGEWQKFLFEVISAGIDIIPPHINHSTEDFEVIDGKIMLPLSIVKNLGEKGVESIIANRPYVNAVEFMAKNPKKSVSKRGRKGLFALGGFDGMVATDKILDIDEITEKTTEEIQETYMGFLLPSRAFLDAVRIAKLGGLKGGIITSKELRKSNWGEYYVYKMLPEGAFWSRGALQFDVGMKVKVKVSEKNGKALSASKLL